MLLCVTVAIRPSSSRTFTRYTVCVLLPARFSIWLPATAPATAPPMVATVWPRPPPIWWPSKPPAAPPITVPSRPELPCVLLIGSIDSTRPVNTDPAGAW
ncbi:hypothetical protein D3C86_1635750 [compost metagenome]